MNFTVSSSILLDHLQKANGAIDSKPTMDILHDFRFDIQDGRLEILGTDLGTSIFTTLDVMAEGDFSCVVPAGLLVDTLKQTPDQPIEFQYDDDTHQVTVTSSIGKYHMASMPIDEFPNLPENENTETLQIKSDVLVAALNNTSFAASKDPARGAMMGVNVRFEPGKLIFAATDAHKLVEFSYEDEDFSVDGSFILPLKSVNLLRSLLPADEEVIVSFNKNNAFFEFGDTRLVCRLIDQEYPNYVNIIPTDNPIELSVNRQSLHDSLKRISIFADKSTRQVVLDIDEDSLTLSAQDLDYSNDAKEQLPCFYKDEPMRVGFNARFLSEMIGALDSEEVVLKIKDREKAVLIFPSEMPENQSILMLIMPVMIKE